MRRSATPAPRSEIASATLSGKSSPVIGSVELEVEPLDPEAVCEVEAVEALFALLAADVLPELGADDELTGSEFELEDGAEACELEPFE